MKRTGYTWNDEYREHFFKSERVQAHLKDFIEQAKQPKTDDQKEKMRMAKLGKPKTEQHRQRMSEVHKFRQDLKKQFQQQHPEKPVEEIWGLVRETMEKI